MGQRLTPLVGTVSFQLHQTTTPRKSRKRPSPDAASAKQQEQRPQLPSGWLLTTPSSKHNRSASFLLQVTVDQTVALVRAQQEGQTIRIASYVLIPNHNNNDVNSMPRNFQGFVQVLGPWTIVGNRNVEERRIKSNTNTEIIWDLHQYRRLEAFHDADAQTNKRLHLKSKKESMPAIRLAATIRAATPILYPHTDPFLLLQLLCPSSSSMQDGDEHPEDDDDNITSITAMECTVVVRGPLLVLWSEALLPGRTVTFTGARTRWKVPQVVGETSGIAIPTHVLVAKAIHSVAPEPPHESLALGIIRGLQGTVTRVRWSKAKQNLESLVLKDVVVVNGVDHSSSPASASTTAVKTTTVELVVIGFPTSPALYQSAQRIGVRLHAYNIHPIDKNVFALLVDSSLSVVSFTKSLSPKPQSPDDGLNVEKTDDNNNNSYSSIKRGGGINDARRTVMQHRLEQWIRDQDWRLSSEQLLSSPSGERRLPSPAQLAEQLFPAAGKSRSNSYADFYLGLHAQATEPTAELPTMHALGFLRAKAMRRLQDCLENYVSQQQQSHKLGWHGCVLMDAAEQMAGRSKTDCYYTGGFWQNGQISTGKIETPFVATTSIADGNAENHARIPNGTFVMCRVVRIVGSCICLGAMPTVANRGTQPESAAATSCHPLPSYDKQQYESMGACSIVIVDGFVYVLGCFIQGSIVHTTAGDGQSEPKATSCSSLLDCLSANDPMPSSTVQGLLLRTSFKVAKIRNRLHGGLQITLCQLPSLPQNTQRVLEICTTQSMDMKPGVEVDEARWSTLRQAFAKVGLEAADDQVGLALAWWSLASTSSSSALTCCGWDTFRAVSQSSTSFGIRVCFPSSTRQLDSIRGYVRFRGELSHLVATFVSIPLALSSVSSQVNFRSFHGESQGKKLPGTLDERPRRSNMNLSAAGVLFPVLAVKAGIPTTTLGGLHLLTCKTLSRKNPHGMSPSLVREIRGATMLGVSYCRAQAECSKCYSFLVNKKQKRGKKAQEDGLVRSVVLGTPNSNDHEQPNAKPTNLVCPNHCDVHRHGSIKWECSGIIDDGTGQAKLYTEREATWALAALTTRDRKVVENGAWQSGQGVQFIANVPPSQALKDAAITAKSIAFLDKKMLTNKVSLTESDVLRYMSPSMQANYVLQRHCRLLQLPQRTYFVRCKPVSDAAYLNHSEIQLAVPGDQGAGVLSGVPTYTLPAVKLNLVDITLPPK